MRKWIDESDLPVIDCSKFKSDKELANAIIASDSFGVVLDGCPDNAHYRRMNQPNPGQVFQIGDIVRMSRDMLESLGMDTDDIENGVVVGVEMSDRGDWFYKVRYDNGRDGLYQHYELDLVASQKDLMNRVILR